MKRALVVGGSSGLGLEIALKLKNEGYEKVFVTGRKNPRKNELVFLPFSCDFSEFQDLGYLRKVATDLDDLMEDVMWVQTGNPMETALPGIDLLVYAAGFYQEGLISDVNDFQIADMIALGLQGPAMLLQRFLSYNKPLPGFIAITSTSEWTPRLKEPVYTAVKAGLKMLANSVSLDERVCKTLVAAPAGMDTQFWRGAPRNNATLLDPKWVAEKIIELYKDNFEYKYARILREPPRVEIIEKR